MAQRLFLIRSFSKFKRKLSSLNQYLALIIIGLFYIIEFSFTLEVSRDPNDVRFYLYPLQGDPLGKVELSMELKNNLPVGDAEGWRLFKRDHVAVLMIHDFGLDLDSYEAQLLKDAYLNSNIDGNYIIVDWGRHATPQQQPGETKPVNAKEDYQKAVDNVSMVGDRIGNFMVNMVKNGFISSTLIHLLGHGLGAHVAGRAGDTFQRLRGGSQIWRITGLDPAAPLFGISNPARKLNRKDAYFVDTIHTDGGFQGDLSVHGHADFYVNGGLHQPGCDDVNTLGLCSHNYAQQIYIAAIQKPFVGCNCPPLLEESELNDCLAQCPNPAYLGPYVLIPTTTGPYYVVADNPP